MTPVVALVTNARPSGSAPRNAATSRAGRVEQPRQVAGQEADRLAPPSGRAARRCASRTGSGHAPNEPWLRNVTAGSSRHPRSVRMPAMMRRRTDPRRSRVGPAAPRPPRPARPAARILARPFPGERYPSPVTRPSPSAAFATWRSRWGGIAPLLVAEFIVWLGFGCLLPVLPLYFTDQGVDLATLGVVIAGVAGGSTGRGADLRLARRPDLARPADGGRPPPGRRLHRPAALRRRARWRSSSCAPPSVWRPPSTTRPPAGTSRMPPRSNVAVRRSGSTVRRRWAGC